MSSEEKIVNVAEDIQRRCLEESEQWPENVDRTPLVLVSGKPVLQNMHNSICHLKLAVVMFFQESVSSTTILHHIYVTFVRSLF